MTQIVDDGARDRWRRGFAAVRPVRSTNHDGARQLREVVRMQGLAEFEHDVVRDIDGEPERAHARCLQSATQPARVLAAADRYRARPARRTDRSRSASSMRTGQPASALLSDRLQPGLPDQSNGNAIRRGEFARKAAHRHRVAAVGSRCNVENVIAKTEKLLGVGSDSAIGRQTKCPSGRRRVRARALSRSCRR